MVTVVRWTGREAKALREALRMSGRDFANHTGLSTSTIADMEAKGDQAHLRHATQQLFDNALAEASEAAKRRFCAILGNTGLRSAAAATSEAIGPAPDGGVSRSTQEVETNRRRATTMIATMLSAASGPAGEVAGWLVDRSPRATPDRMLLAGHAQIGELLAGMYRAVDPRAVLPMATAYADDLLDQRDQAEGVEFTRVVVGVHAQVGLWACHADRPSHAHRYLATACEIAASSGDPPLHARALGALSYLHSSAARGGVEGNPHRALRLLDDGLTMAEGADPFTRGWLATWRADQHAAVGNLASARADIELATTALAAGNDGQTSGFFSLRHYGYGMSSHLDSVRALVDGLAGQTDAAERGFATVQAQAANGRRRAATYAHQALAYAKAPAADPEAACAALRKAINHAASDHYAMGLKRAAGVRRGFHHRWSDLPCVRDIDEHLRHLPTAA